MFELGQLRCFVAVAEELHFGRAAARLNMTQPPLSRQVQILEHGLDIILLERTSRLVRLTPAGRAFLPEARRIIELAEGAGLAAKRVARGEQGSIGLGCTAAASYGLLPKLLAFASASMPGIDLVLKQMVTSEQMEALASGRIDLGLVRQPFDRRLVADVCILREPLLLAVPGNHPLATGAEPSIADLDRQKMVMVAGGVPLLLRFDHRTLHGGRGDAGACPVCQPGAHDPGAGQRRPGCGAGAGSGTGVAL